LLIEAFFVANQEGVAGVDDFIALEVLLQALYNLNSHL
jgi:hypothetical protein